MGAISKNINYEKIREGQKEFQRADLWMMSFVRTPSGVYFPGQDLLDIRCKTFDPGISDDPTIIEEKIRGYTVVQGARPGDTSATITMTLKDRDDQTISYFVDQWKIALGDRDALQGLPKAYYTSDIIFTMYDVLENPLRKIKYFNCIPQSGSLGETGADEPGALADIPLTLKAEHFTRNLSLASE